MRMIPIVVLGLTTAAYAAPLRPYNEGDVPPACRSMEHGAAPTLQLQLAQRISVASCMASIRLDALRSLGEPGAAIPALANAVAPSIAMLDEVIANGDAGRQIVAEHAKGDLYVGLAVRLRNTVPPIGPLTTGPALKIHDDAHDALEPSARAWVEAGGRAFTEVEHIASIHPELDRDPVIHHAVDLSTASLDSTIPLVGVR